MVKAVLAATQQNGATTRMIGGTDLSARPHFAPDSAERSDAQREFVEAVRGAGGIVIGSPCYHGGVSGLVKNAIDLFGNLLGDWRAYFYGVAAGLIVTAAGWQACGVTFRSLRGIVHAMRDWQTPIGIAVSTLEQQPFAENGSPPHDSLQRQVSIQADQIMLLAGVSR
jgi:FMN reductase